MTWEISGIHAQCDAPSCVATARVNGRNKIPASWFGVDMPSVNRRRQRMVYCSLVCFDAGAIEIGERLRGTRVG